MKPHDCEDLSDFLCWHADHFAARLATWRERLRADALAFRAARADAQKRFPLEGDEVTRMDEYIATRFGVPKAAHDSKALPVPMMVVR